MPPRLLKQDFRFKKGVDGFSVPQLITKLSIEALVGAILSRRPRSMNKIFTPTLDNQSRMLFAVNSGPLSLRI